MRTYLRRRRRHFIIFAAFILICFLRTGFFERILQGVFLLPLTADDYWLFSCMIFLVFFLYATAVGYRFDEGGIAKKYPILPEKYYRLGSMRSYKMVSGASTIWTIEMEDGKKLILPGYIPGVDKAAKEFLAQANLPKTLS